MNPNPNPSTLEYLPSSLEFIPFAWSYRPIYYLFRYAMPSAGGAGLNVLQVYNGLN